MKTKTGTKRKPKTATKGKGDCLIIEADRSNVQSIIRQCHNGGFHAAHVTSRSGEHDLIFAAPTVAKLKKMITNAGLGGKIIN